MFNSKTNTSKERKFQFCLTNIFKFFLLYLRSSLFCIMIHISFRKPTLYVNVRTEANCRDIFQSVWRKWFLLYVILKRKKRKEGREREKWERKKKLSRYKNWSCKKRKSKKQRRELTNWHLAKSNKGEKGKLCNMDSTNPKTEFYQMRSYVNQIRFFCIIKTDTNDTI